MQQRRQGRELRLGEWLVYLSLFGLGLACQSGGRGDPVNVPDSRVALDEGGDASSADASAKGLDSTPFDPKTFDPRIPIKLDQPLSEVATLWQAGASQLLIRENRVGDCEAVVDGSCSDEEEWRLERSSRRFIHSTCVCGKSQTQEKVLNPSEFKMLEERIVGLGTASNPAPCTSDAPEVTLELTSAEGQPEAFKVNYGQCAGTLAPRIDLESFEKLVRQLTKIPF